MYFILFFYWTSSASDIIGTRNIYLTLIDGCGYVNLLFYQQS